MKGTNLFLISSTIVCLTMSDLSTFAQRPNVSAPRNEIAATSSARAQDFDTLAAQASAAREADKVNEAIGLYRQALAIRPSWAEGWWFLGTLYYDLNDFGAAGPAFKRA